MKRIAVMGQKGGIGKTTTATSLAYILAKDYGRRVLLIDADRQGNASQIMGAYDPEKRGLHSLLTAVHQEESVETVAQATAYENIDMIPTNDYLADAVLEVAMDTEYEQAHRLDNALAAVEKKYDFAIIDCGLVIDMAVLNALVAADMWLVPVKPGGFEADALTRMQDQLMELRSLNAGLELMAVPCMIGKSKANQENLAWIRQSGTRCTKATVHRSVIGEKYTAHLPGPLPIYSPRSGLAKDYRELALEIMERMEEKGRTEAAREFIRAKGDMMI